MNDFSNNVPRDLNDRPDFDGPPNLQPTADDNCTRCYYAVREQKFDMNGQPEIGQHFYTCHALPPVPIVIPTGPQSANLTAHFPIVHAGLICGHYDPQDSGDDGAENGQ